MPYIYKILKEKEWREFNQKGEFAGSAIDIKDGFIHLSTAEQQILIQQFQRNY